jgi:hypothetical protein
MRSRYGVAQVVAPLLLAAAVATGCSDDQDPGSQPTPSASTETESPAGEALPDDFPADEVPLVGGEVTKVLENPGLGSYLVEVRPDVDFQAAFADATAQLQGAGFEMGKDLITAGPDSSTADFTSADWRVVVTGGVPAPLLQYTIYPAE